MMTPLNGHTAAVSPLPLGLPKEIATCTVQQFFGQISWEGVPVTSPWATPTAAGTEAVPQPLSKRMSVAQFFSYFLWEGTPTIGAPGLTISLQEDPAPAAQAFTLDDFSSLF